MRTAKSCGPDAPMLASSVAVAHRSNWIERDIREATVTTSPARRGEHDISRKAIAQGMSDASAALYARVRIFLRLLHTRPRVQRAPGIPCALCLEG
jgi:hypothetical protein